MATSTIAYFLTLRTRPLAFVAQDVARVHVEVSEQAAVAEEGGALIASPSTPFGMVDAAEMAEARCRGVLGAHEIVDGCAEGLLTIGRRRRFGLEAHDFAGAVEDLRTVGWRYYLGPGVRVGVFAGAAIEVAEETQVEVGALCAADMAVPDGGAAEVASGDDGIGEADELDRSGRSVVYRFVVDHLAEEAREQR